LSTALLVRDEHLAQVRASIDSRHLGTRIVIEAIGIQFRAPRPVPDELSLVNRVRVAPGGFHDWLVDRLSRRFDFACVEHPDQLDEHERAVTVQGQVKLAERRYEKDDRFRVDDRLRWVLGGDNQRKTEMLLARRRDVDERMRTHQAELDAHQSTRDAAIARRKVLEQLRARSWSEYDMAPAAARLARLRDRKRELDTTSPELAAASAAHEQAKATYDEVRADATRAEQRRLEAAAHLDEVERAIIDSERASANLPAVDATLVAQLDERYRAPRRRLDRTALTEIGRVVPGKLRDERDAARDQADRAAIAFTADAARFRERWPAASVD